MAKKATKPSRKTAERIDEEKERNCRRTLAEFLQFMEYECPTTDATTLREEADRKLKEIKKKELITHQESHSPTSVACEINMVDCDEGSIATSTDSMDSSQTKNQGPSRFNHCGGKFCKVKRYIEKIHGAKMAEFVCEKKLTASDVNPSQCRLLMPLKQVYRQDILERMERMEGVRLYVPSRIHHYDVCLTKWDMSSNQNYVLKSGWIKVVKENELEKTMVVQLWSFQVEDFPSLFLLVDGDKKDVDGDSCVFKRIVSSDEVESTRVVVNDDEIFGFRKPGGVIIREPNSVVESSTSDRDGGRIVHSARGIGVGTSGCNGGIEDEGGEACVDKVEKCVRSRKGKERVHEF